MSTIQDHGRARPVSPLAASGSLQAESMQEPREFYPYSPSLEAEKLMRLGPEKLMSLGTTKEVRFGSASDQDWVFRIDREINEAQLEWKLLHNEIVIGEADGRQVGYLRLEFLWTTLPYIGLIHVMPEYRKSGMGRSMLAYLERHLAFRGVTRLFSSSQADEKEPQAWHRHMGFQDCGFLTHINSGDVGEVFFYKDLARI